ncbi:hypothetical protein ACB094_12G113000 [Castanea mollissima]
MALHRLLSQQQLLLFGWTILVVTAASQPNSSCINSCGSLSIPYLFGTSEGCYFDESFSHYFNLTMLNISLDGELRVSNFVAYGFYNKSGHVDNDIFQLSLLNFSISYMKNNLSRGQNYTIGCLSLCDYIDSVVNGSCSGIGCCQTSIPEGVTSLIVGQGSFNYHSTVLNFNPCGFGFVGEEDAYNFSSLDLKFLQNRTTIPLDAKRNLTSYACKVAYSECYNFNNGLGYRCNYSLGFQGNPYLLDGCQDIDECVTLNTCNKQCHNFPGSFSCSCPKGYEGDGLRNGIESQLTDNQSRSIIIALGKTETKKAYQAQKRFFQQNGGILLQQGFSNHRGSIETAKLFTEEDLKKATNNYHESRVLGQGGSGTVYKGVLPDNKVVAINKSRIGDQSQIDPFINEMILLSQVNHKNVVKILGCCLEIEVSLLVYEFITNGTLSYHIHDKDISSLLLWEKCLKIAAEIARALAYLHSTTSVPIIHRDVKSTNILLDDNYIAKVSDFGASRLVPLDQTQLTTLVQGTFGYLNPEYFHSSQLTEKSDVYIFGVVMAELLSGKKAISFDRPESERNLAMHFVSVVKENRLLQIFEDHIVKEGSIQHLKEVANLAIRCLSVRGEDRPSMKEVAMELEGLRITKKLQWRNVDVYIEETECLLNAPTHSLNIDFGIGCSSIRTTTGYDSMRNQVLKTPDDGKIS